MRRIIQPPTWRCSPIWPLIVCVTDTILAAWAGNIVSYSSHWLFTVFQAATVPVSTGGSLSPDVALTNLRTAPSCTSLPPPHPHPCDAGDGGVMLPCLVPIKLSLSSPIYCSVRWSVAIYRHKTMSYLCGAIHYGWRYVCRKWRQPTITWPFSGIVYSVRKIAQNAKSMWCM